MPRLVIAITGASGATYGERAVLRAVAPPFESRVDLLVSSAGQRVAQDELGYPLDPSSGPFAEKLGTRVGMVKRVPVADIGAEAASGSIPFDGMIVIPCSMGTLGRIAHGLASNLIERAADVMMKERRPLVLVPRETPFNRIHLENMLKLDAAGARIVPAMPAFYSKPASIEDLVDTVVDRALSFFFGTQSIRSQWQPERERGR